MDYTNDMAIYIVELEKRNKKIEQDVTTKTKKILQQIKLLSDVRLQVSTFKGYEPGYDRKITELETSKKILDELKTIWKKY